MECKWINENIWECTEPTELNTACLTHENVRDWLRLSKSWDDCLSPVQRWLCSIWHIEISNWNCAYLYEHFIFVKLNNHGDTHSKLVFLFILLSFTQEHQCLQILWVLSSLEALEFFVAERWKIFFYYR